MGGLKQEKGMWVKGHLVIKAPVCGLAAKFPSELSLSLCSPYFQSIPAVTYYTLMYTPPPPQLFDSLMSFLLFS